VRRQRLRVGAAALALLVLAGCRADVEALQALVPEALEVTEVVGSQAKLFNCARATFRAETRDPAALAQWSRLGRLFRPPMLECLDLKEKQRWNQAIAGGTALWTTIEQPEKAHLWFDTDTGFLQVLRLEDGF
jgi:hypothetical protein